MQHYGDGHEEEKLAQHKIRAAVVARHAAVDHHVLQSLDDCRRARVPQRRVSAVDEINWPVCDGATFMGKRLARDMRPTDGRPRAEQAAWVGCALRRASHP